MLNIYHAEDFLDFGKNKGLKLREIYKFQPSYLEWAIVTLDDFKIDLESFKNLNPPTTIGYYRDQFNPSRIALFQDNTLIESMEQGITGDTLNNYKQIGVSEIKDMILEDCTQGVKIKGYTFPEWVVNANNSK